LDKTKKTHSFVPRPFPINPPSYTHHLQASRAAAGARAAAGRRVTARRVSFAVLLCNVTESPPRFCGARAHREPRLRNARAYPGLLALDAAAPNPVAVVPAAHTERRITPTIISSLVAVGRCRRSSSSPRQPHPLLSPKNHNIKMHRQPSVVRPATATSVDWPKTAADLDPKSPLEIMDHALATFGPDAAIAFSGAEDVALVEYAHLTGRPFRVFSLDTGRLNPETYELFAAVEKRYGVRIEYTFPDTQEVIDLVQAKGLFSFYEDGHQECCRARKVRPLRKHLRTLGAWITGQRKDQSPGTRMAVPVVEVDPVFEGAAGGPGSLVKYNPLSNCTSAEVWNFLRAMGVPTNALHERGYVSIGCAPCTRAVLPNQPEREGRWWWEDAAAKECGLHSGNIKGGGKEGEGAAGQPAARDLWAAAGADGAGAGGGSKVESLTRAQAEALAASADKDTLLVAYAPWCQFCQALEPAYEELAARLEGSHVRVAKFQADGGEGEGGGDRAFAEKALGLKTFPTIVMLPKSQPGKAIKYPVERRDADSLQMWVTSLTGRG